MEHGGSDAVERDVHRVFLVDDHEMVREGLRHLIDGRAGCRVVGDAGTHADAIARIPATRPDVVVVDLQLPDADGLTTCRDALALRPDVRVLVLTASADPALVRRAANVGAAGYVVKTVRCGVIIAAVESVANGERVFDVAMADEPSDEVGADPDPAEASLAALSGTERTILHLIVEGHTNHRIARDLGLSEKSVKKQVSSIFASLGVTSRVAAAVIATRYATWVDLSGAGI